MMLDHISKLLPVVAFAPAAAVTNTTEQVSTTLDIQGAGSASLVLLTGALADADATFTLTLYESDSSIMSGETAVADGDLIGTEAQASFDFADDSLSFWIGYKGSKRYIRAKVAIVGNADTAYLSGVWLKGHLESAPAARN